MVTCGSVGDAHVCRFGRLRGAESKLDVGRGGVLVCGRLENLCAGSNVLVRGQKELIY